MKTLMRNGRDRQSENPSLGHAKQERVSLFGTDQRITSGPVARRPHSKAEYMTAPERFADSQIPLAPRAPSIHDPIFAAIEAHARAHIAHCAALDYAAEEHWLPDGSRCQSPDCPELLAREDEAGDACGVEADATRLMVRTCPTTPAGAAALLKYIVEHEERVDEGCITEVLMNVREGYDDELAGQRLLKTLATALERMVRS
jgi:hypothetical protein